MKMIIYNVKVYKNANLKYTMKYKNLNVAYVDYKYQLDCINKKTVKILNECLDKFQNKRAETGATKYHKTIHYSHMCCDIHISMKSNQKKIYVDFYGYNPGEDKYQIIFSEEKQSGNMGSLKRIFGALRTNLKTIDENKVSQFVF